GVHIMVDEDVLTRELQRARRRLAAAEGDLARVLGAPELQRHAELLKTVAGKVKRFDREARAVDYATGETVCIALQPGAPLAEQIEKKFKLANRLRAAEPRVRARISEIEKEIAALEDGEAAPAPAPAPAKKSAEPEAPRPYREYWSASQRAIWVGK